MENELQWPETNPDDSKVEIVGHTQVDNSSLCIEKIEKWSLHALFDTRRTRKPFVLLGGLIKRFNLCIERFPDRVNLVRSLSSVHSRVI